MKVKLFNRPVVTVNIVVGVIILTNLLAFAGTPVSTYRLDNLSQSLTQVEPSVVEIARQITVRIFTNPGAGSGVIIDRQGQTYTVLTCAHVANASRDESYKVLTSNGQTYVAFRRRVPALQGVDLALVQFESKTPYQVAIFGNYEDISIEKQVYISGFPNYREQGLNALDVTYDWGLKAFQLVPGNISMLLLDRSLHRGYQLGYTNPTKGGMSGGAVLDNRGRLIGIHGRGQRPIQGINAFKFTDGKTPSVKLYEQMYGLSWAITIFTFQQRMGQLPAASKIIDNLRMLPTRKEKPLITPTRQPKI